MITIDELKSKLDYYLQNEYSEHFYIGCAPYGNDTTKLVIYNELNEKLIFIKLSLQFGETERTIKAISDFIQFVVYYNENELIISRISSTITFCLYKCLLFLYSEENDLVILVSYNDLEQIKERLENLKFLNMTYHSYHMAWAQEALMSIKSISDDDFKK